jgi:hypothetical protein
MHEKKCAMKGMLPWSPLASSECGPMEGWWWVWWERNGDGDIGILGGAEAEGRESTSGRNSWNEDN